MIGSTTSRAPDRTVDRPLWQDYNLATHTTKAMSNAVKMNFPGPVGGKRRRMRSGGGAVNYAEDQTTDNIAEEKLAQTSKCKGAQTIPIFLKSKLPILYSDD